jgi:hypothetical protein
MAQQTAVTGNRYDFTTMSAEGETSPNYGGVPFILPKGCVQGASWDGQQEAGTVQGNQISIVGRTNGMATGSGSIELLVSEADDWIATITGQGAFPVMSVFFNLRFTYSVNGTDVRVDTLQGVKITKVGAANQKGSEATVRTYELSIAQIYENGIALWGDPPLS